MSTKEIQEGIVANMKRWQEIEGASVASTSRIIKKTDNPIVQLVMEIIQRDSRMHHRVQGLIIDSLEAKAIALTPDELGTVWEMIEAAGWRRKPSRLLKNPSPLCKGRRWSCRNICSTTC